MLLPPAESLTRDEAIEKKSQLLQDGKVFEDNYAIATENVKKGFVWKRPQEISPSPKMTVSGYENTNFVCGPKSSPYFVSVLAAVARRPDFIDAIFPDGQNFEKDYCGLFYYRFWTEGVWTYVTIDDRILVDQEENFTLFTGSRHKDEFWVQLLEKAFAKHCGRYEDLTCALDGLLVLLTGGITEITPVKPRDPDNFLELKKLYNSDAVLLVALNTQLFNPDSFATTPEPLPSQRFTILSVDVVGLDYRLGNAKNAQALCRLVKLKNAFGKPDWTSTWEKAATDWLNLPEPVRQKYRLTVNDDSEFYLSYEDFKRGTTELTVCTLPGCKIGWAIYDCSGYLSTFTFTQDKAGFDICKFDTIKLQYFPQFKVNAVDVFNENKVELIISLFIFDSCQVFRQFFVFQLNRAAKLPLDQTFFAFNQPVYRSRLSSDVDLVSKVEVEPGQCLVVAVFDRVAEPIRYALRVASVRDPKNNCTSTAGTQTEE